MQTHNKNQASRGGDKLVLLFTIMSVITRDTLLNTRGFKMRRIITTALAIVFVLAMTALAGEYHQGSSLSCYQCHTMHYSQSHLFGYAHEDEITMGPDGPYNYLLRDQINELCLSCHDGGDVIDVYGASDVYAATNRQGGFLNKVGDANANCGHTLGATNQAPGSNPAWSPDATEGLTCADCHSPHGSAGTGNPDAVKGQWRILQSRPGSATTRRFVNYEKSSEPVDLTKDVKWRAASPFIPGTSYETASTDFYEPVATESRYGAWCQGCHTDFHGNSSNENMHNAEGWIRHPAAEANLDAADFGTHAYRPQVMSPTGVWGTQGDSTFAAPADLTPTCVTCHKGHGNNNAFGLVYMSGRQPRSENGDATAITATCKICHRQGGY